MQIPPSHLLRVTLITPSPAPSPSITVSPLTSDDWEILSLNASAVEQRLLQQVQVVTVGLTFPFYVSPHQLVQLRVTAVKGGGAGGAYARLALESEVIVAPRVRKVEGRVGGEETAGLEPLPRRWRLRVQQWPRADGPEAASDVDGGAALSSRCVYVNADTMRAMRMKQHDLVLLQTVTASASASPSVLAPSAASLSVPARTVCRLLLHQSVAAHHVLLSASLLYHLRLAFHSPVTLSALHPTTAALCSRHVRSLSLAPVVQSRGEGQDDERDELASAFLSWVGRRGKERGKGGGGGLPVEEEAVLDVELKGGRTVRVRLLVNADSRGSGKGRGKTAEEEEKEKTAAAARQQQPALTVSQPLLYYLLSDPQQLQLVTASKLPPLPLPRPTVLPPLLMPAVFSPAPPAPSHLLQDIGGLSSFLSLALSHLLSFFPSAPPLSNPSSAFAPASSGLMLVGEEGTGKSMIARALAHHLYTAHAVHTQTLDSRGDRPGSAKDRLQAALEQARRCAPSVLLLEDLQLLLPADDEQDGSSALQTDALASAFCQLLASCCSSAAAPVVCLVTATSASAVHPALSSSLYFPTVLQVPSLSATDREDVVVKVLRRRGARERRRGVARRASERMEGYRGRDVEQLVTRAIHAAISRQWGEEAAATHDSSGSGGGRSPISISREDVDIALLGFVPSSVKDLPAAPAAVGWDDIGGLEEAKQTLTDTLQLPTQFAPLFARLPLKLRSGILLYGPPGCGKSVLAAAAASHAGLRFIAVKGPELLNKYIGSSESAVRDVFVRARAAAPCLLLFDEMEAIATRRGGESTGVTDRVVNQFLCELDGVEGGASGAGGTGESGAAAVSQQRVYVVAASSRPDLLDAALLRPGRIDKSVYIGFPSEAERVDILTRMLRYELQAAQQRDAEEAAQLRDCILNIARDSDGYSGADLSGLLTNAQMIRVHDHLDSIKQREEKEEEKEEKGEKEEEAALPPLTPAVLSRAFAESSPSVSAADRRDFARLYSRFIAAKEGNLSDTFDPHAKLRTAQA